MIYQDNEAIADETQLKNISYKVQSRAQNENACT